MQHLEGKLISVCLNEGSAMMLIITSPDIAPPASLIETRQIMSCHESASLETNNNGLTQYLVCITASRAY